MGSSTWDYRVPFVDTVESALVSLQERLLAAGDFDWPWEDYGDDGGRLSERPTTIDELSAAKDVDEFWQEGTHSILDVDHVERDVTADRLACIFPLTDEELIRVFGSTMPTDAEVTENFKQEVVGKQLLLGPLHQLEGGRWTGRSLIIYDGVSPVEVFFWGNSGD